MIPIFDRQHIGKRSRPGDKGAVWLDGDVVIAHETTLTGWYIHHAMRSLAAAGIGSKALDYSKAAVGMDYSERHRVANTLAGSDWRTHQVPYIACHVNAGGGDYGLIGYDPRSLAGKKLAGALASELARLPWLSRVRVEAAEGGWSRMLGTIRGIYSGPANISAVCFEPFFIDHPAHQQGVYRDECAAVGNALARGLMRYAGMGDDMSNRPGTWGTTATLTMEGKRSVLAVTFCSFLAVLAMAYHDQSVSLVGYAEVIGVIAGAAILALAGVNAAGTNGHSRQYAGIGSPTGRKPDGPALPPLVGSQSIAPMREPPALDGGV